MSNVRPVMRAWHDYHLTGYAVDGTNARITFEVSWPYESEADIGRAVVVFSGVEGYFFEHDLGANILYSLAEQPLEPFLAEHAEHFERERKWGWPLFWKGGVEQTATHLAAKHVKCFEVSSSYGLSGWVLATNVEHYVPQA
jgi:hypothetical protein